MIAAALTVLRKEVTDNFRDRRTLFSALVFGPLFGPAFFALMISIMLAETVAGFEEPLELPVVGADHAPNLVRFLQAHNAEIQPAPDDAERAVREGEHDVVLIIPPEYPEQFTAGLPARVLLAADSADSRAQKSIARARALLNAYAQQTTALRVVARGISPHVISPLIVENLDVATPTGRSVLVLGMMTYFVLFAALMGGMYLATDTTAGERERGSLEPLLTLPVPRVALTTGKLAATAVYMTASLTITLAAFTVGLQLVPLEKLGMSTNFGPVVALKVLALMLPFVVLGAALLTAVASFTRSYKEAQTYLSLVLIVPTLPIVFAAIYSLRPELWMMTVPSLAQHLLITELLKGEALDPLQLAVAVASTLALGLALSAVVTWLYGREKILG